LLHPGDLLARAVQPIETNFVSLLTLQYLSPFSIQEIFERVDELQIGRRRDVIITSQLPEEILCQLLRGRMEILTHRDAGVTFVFWQVKLAEELRGNREQGILGPGLQPVDGAAVHQCGEFAVSVAEAVADRRHSQHYVQMFTHRLHEEVEESHRTAVRLHGPKHKSENINLIFIFNYYFKYFY